MGSSRRKRRRQLRCQPVSTPAPIPPPTTTAETVTEVQPSEAHEEQRKVDDGIYEKFREQLSEREWDAGKEYDKWMMTVSGVLLGFSLTLVKDLIRPSGLPTNAVASLWVGWIGLALPLVLGLINLQFSYSATVEYRAIVDEEFENYSDSATFWGNVRRRFSCVKRVNWIPRFNWAGMISFVVGVIALAIFVAFNLQGANGEQRKPQGQSGQVVQPPAEAAHAATAADRPPRDGGAADAASRPAAATPPTTQGSEVKGA